MTRYQALRKEGCPVVGSVVIALINWMFKVPAGRIVFMNVVMEYEP